MRPTQPYFFIPETFLIVWQNWGCLCWSSLLYPKCNSDGSGWTPWSQWSSCQIPDGKAPTEQNCHQTRMRTCAINYGANENLKGDKSSPTTCVGENKQTRSCSSELCQHILEESGGIMLTPASDLKRTQKDEGKYLCSLNHWCTFLFIWKP